MSTQLSLFWQAADELSWYWTGDTDVYSGTLEELQSQKQKKNLGSCITRLFLPANWFSTIELQLPSKARRINSTVLKFAAEEYLAQDIESVHLVVKHKTPNGLATVEVTDVDRFRQIIQTLKARQFMVTEAFNTQWFQLVENQTEDVVLQVEEQFVTVSSNDQIFTVHTKGFTQWYEIWAQQQGVEDDATVKVISDEADGPAKTMVTEFEAAGVNVQWVVQTTKKLIDWHDQAEAKKQLGNLITGEFNQGSGESNSYLWIPAVAASVAALVLWSGVSIASNYQLAKQVDETWQASENVFKQVFGQGKRIQRPLMLREMRSLASDNPESAGSEVNALTFLNEINASSSTFVLEDFRFNRDRNESFFTIVQPLDAPGDAFSLFESLKDTLTANGYEATQKANKDKDAYRAVFKVVYGGQG
jgi:type II secretion system protein L